MIFPHYFSMLNWSARIFQGMTFLANYIEESENQKILHVACHNLSKYDVTLALHPILAVWLAPNYDLKHPYITSFIFFLFHKTWKWYSSLSHLFAQINIWFSTKFFCFCFLSKALLIKKKVSFYIVIPPPIVKQI